MPAALDQRIQCREVAREGWTEVFLTARAERPLEAAAEVRGAFDALAETLAGRGVGLLQERVYGPASAMAEVLAARRDALAAAGLPDSPVTFIEGRPCVGGLLAGVQATGAVVAGGDARLADVTYDGRPAGRLLETPTHRSIYLSGVSDPACRKGTCVTDQGTRMFDRAAAVLRQEGFAPTDIVRTWIYLARLLDWYGEFNRVRTACFRRWGLVGAGQPGPLPASTGIQGRRHAGEECFLDLLAVARRDGTRAGIEPMRNTRQNEATEYGSSFARGMAVGVDGPADLYISGTASIDPRGRTVYHGDHQGQVLETMLDVHALLRTRAAAFRDIVQATAYCKEERDYGTFRRVLDFMGWEDMPVVPVYADVCRDELLFEMDAVAVAGGAAAEDARAARG